MILTPKKLHFILIELKYTHWSTHELLHPMDYQDGIPINFFQNLDKLEVKYKNLKLSGK